MEQSAGTTGVPSMDVFQDDVDPTELEHGSTDSLNAVALQSSADGTHQLLFS